MHAAQEDHRSPEAPRLDPPRRFEFGRNWQRFLPVIDHERIREAEQSLREMLATDSLAGQRLLDIGCGSGLFSLAARHLGAAVHSFDYDPDSVECTRRLKARFRPEDPHWKIERGSVLDETYMQSLGVFDVVYSWGVLHHTGRLWQALDNAAAATRPGGTLYVAIYNDQGWQSRVWWWIKRLYNTGPLARALMVPIFYSLFFLAGLAIDCLHGTDPRRRYREHKRHRGMSLTHDWLDWLGGFPYEYASRQAVESFVADRGFRPLRYKPPPIGFGNHQLVFTKLLPPTAV